MNYIKIHDSIIMLAIKKNGQNNPFHRKVAGHHMHHIKPKCMGGTNKKENIVALTPREHFLVHWLLWKIHGGKMAVAFKIMSHGKHTAASRLTSKVYDQLCRDANAASFVDQGWRDNHFRAINRSDTHPEWHKNTIAAARKKVMDPEWIRKNREAVKKTIASDEWKISQKRGALKLARPTVAIDVDGEIVDCIVGVHDAKLKGYCNKNISAAIHGKAKTHKGYTWRYATYEEVEKYRPGHEWLELNKPA